MEKQYQLHFLLFLANILN